MARQSCGGLAPRQGSKRTAAQAQADAAKAPAAKVGRPRKQPGTPQGQAEELVSPQALEFMKQHGVSKASVEPVIEVVKHPQSGLPTQLRDLLLATLPWSLAVPANRRHEVQQEVIPLMDGVFGTVQAELQRALDAKTSKVDELRAQQAELTGAAERAEAASSEARSATEDQGKGLAQAASMLVQAREALQTAEREETKLGAELSQTRALVSELEDALSGSFRRLKDSDFEDGEVGGLVQAVMAAGAKSCLEEALVTTLPICLAKRERGAFDQTVIGEAQHCIQGKIASLKEIMEAAAPIEAQAAVREARAALDAAVAEQAQAAADLRSAQAESSEAAAGAKAAKAAAAEFDAKLAPALEVQGARQGELDHFRSYNVFLYELLRDRTVEKESAGEDAGAVLTACLAGA